MKGLKRDDVGRPVPFFVAYVDGKPDFRTMDGRHLRMCLLEDLCWVCGTKLPRRYGKRTGTFVAGPMCLINRTSAEPPSHRECAEWSARACPFLTNPNKGRREANMPEGGTVAGVSIDRNPGVTALIESDEWHPWDAGNGMLIEFRRIRSVEFMAEGRPASVKEVMESIETGIPLLYDMAKDEGQGATLALMRKLCEALGWIPDSDVALRTGNYPMTETLAFP